VLESGEVVRLGANEPRPVDVRFVSATNRDLHEMMKAGTFREDLFFRVNAATIHIPPLRDRREDIPQLVMHDIHRFAPSLAPDRPEPVVTDAAMLRLTAYDWPGNVRQLLNTVQHMVVTGLGTSDQTDKPTELGVELLPEEIRTAEGDGGVDLSGTGSLAGASLGQLEKRAIRETLRLTEGNRERAAKLLGIGERTLYRKLREYGLR